MTVPIDGTLEKLAREVIPRRLHKLQLNDAMSLQGDLGIDSIGLMSLAFRIEEEFQIDFMQQPDRVASARTLGDVRELIRDLTRGLDGGAP